MFSSEESVQNGNLFTQIRRLKLGIWLRSWDNLIQHVHTTVL